MTNQPQFAIGDRVRMSKRGIEHLVRPGCVTPTTGYVARLGKTSLSVWIRRDGRKVAKRYHVAFWERVRERGAKAGGA